MRISDVPLHKLRVNVNKDNYDCIMQSAVVCYVDGWCPEYLKRFKINFHIGINVKQVEWALGAQESTTVVAYFYV
jgi:hypothetical protein